MHFRSKEGYTVFQRLLITVLEGNYQHFPLILILTHRIRTRQRSWGQEETHSSKELLSLITSSDGQAEGSPHSYQHDYQVKSVSEIISIQNGQSSCRSCWRGTTYQNYSCSMWTWRRISSRETNGWNHLRTAAKPATVEWTVHQKLLLQRSQRWRFTMVLHVVSSRTLRSLGRFYGTTSGYS